MDWLQSTFYITAIVFFILLIIAIVIIIWKVLQTTNMVSKILTSGEIANLIAGMTSRIRYGKN